MQLINIHKHKSYRLDIGASMRRTDDGRKIEENIMTQHTSLKSVSKIVTQRNVLKRFERIDLLRARGKWKEGDRVLGLPKTKPQT